MKKPVVGLVAAVVAQVVFGLGTGDYVQRGLVAHWDAVDNVGTGTHDPVTTVWKDLSGHGLDWQLREGNYEWSERGFEMLGKGVAADGLTKTNLFNRLTTVEFVYAAKADKDGFIFSTGIGAGDGVGASHAALIWLKLANGIGVYNPEAKADRRGFYASVGETNACSVVYVRTGYKPSGVESILLNGQPHESDPMADYWGPGETAPALGDRIHKSNSVPVTGTLLALRIYDRPLTVEESALNHALDRIRLFGDDPEQVALPAGYRWAADGSVEKMAYRWTGNGGDGNWTTAANWGFEDGRSALLAPGEDDEAVIGSAAVSLPAGKTGTLAKLTLGEGASLNVAADGELKVRRIYAGNAVILFGVHTAANATWLGGEGRVTVGDYAALSQQYVRGGLVAQWDAIDNTGEGRHETKSTMRWVDASGNGYDWLLDAGYRWDDASLQLLGDFQVGAMPGKTSADFKRRITTMEFIWASEDERDGIIFTPGIDKATLLLTLKHNANISGGTNFWLGAYAPENGSVVHYGVNIEVGETNCVRAVYARSGDAPTGVSKLVKNGLEAAAVDFRDYWGSGTAPALCGRFSANGKSPFAKGRLLALRIYDRELTEEEAAINYALDRVRYFGEDPATAPLPDGLVFGPDGRIRRAGYVWTGRAGDGKWSTLGNWQYENGREIGVLPGAESAVAIPASAQIEIDGKASCASIELGAGAALTVADGVELAVTTLCYDGVEAGFGGYSGTAVKGRRADWAKGAGYVCVFRNVAATSDAYVRDGLVANWDGADNAGTGVHVADYVGWADLTGNGYDWTFNKTGWMWDGNSLLMSGGGVIGTMPDKDTTAFNGKLTTLECTLSLATIHEGVVFVPGFGSTTYLATSKQNTFMLGFYIPKGGGSAYYKVNVGATNVYQVTYARQQDMPTDVESTLLNGEPGARLTTNDPYTIEGGPALGARPNTDSHYPAKGNLFAMRIYSRELTKMEQQLNRALDRVRLLRENPALVELPEGYCFDDDGRLVVSPYVWTGAAGDGQWNNAGNWQLADGSSVTTAPRAGAAVDLAAATAVSVSGLGPLELKSLALGASTVLSLAADSRLMVGTVTVGGTPVAGACYSRENVRAATADWLAGAGVVSVAGDGSANYPELPPVRNGTILYFDVPAGGCETWSAAIGADITAVVKTGAGEQRLAGSSEAFAGDVSVNAGTLTADSPAAFGGADVVVTVADGAAVAAGALAAETPVAAQVLITGAGVGGTGALRVSDRCESGGFGNVALAGNAAASAAAPGGIVGGVLDLRGHTLDVLAEKTFAIGNATVTNTLATADEKVGEIVIAREARLQLENVVLGGADGILRPAESATVLRKGNVEGAGWKVQNARPYFVEGVSEGSWNVPFDLVPGTTVDQTMTEVTNTVAAGVHERHDAAISGYAWWEKAGKGLTTFGDVDCRVGGVEVLGGGLRLLAKGKTMTFGHVKKGGFTCRGTSSIDVCNPGGTVQVFNACYPAMGGGDSLVRFRGGDVYFGGGSSQGGKIDLGRGQGEMIVSADRVKLSDFYYTLTTGYGGAAALTVDGSSSVLEASAGVRVGAYIYPGSGKEFNASLNLAHGGTLEAAWFGFYRRDVGGGDVRNTGDGATFFHVNVDGGVIRPLAGGGLCSTAAEYGTATAGWNANLTLTVAAGGLTLDTSKATGAVKVEGPLVKPAGEGKRLVSVALPDAATLAANRYMFLRPVVIESSTGKNASAFMSLDDDTLCLTNVTVSSGGSGYAATDKVKILSADGGSYLTCTPVWADAATAAESRGFIKRGEKDAELLNANTYLGPTTVESGLLKFTHAQSLPEGSSLVIGATGTADLGGHAFTVPTVEGLGVVTNGNLTVTEGIAMTADEFKVRQGLVVKGRVTFAEGAKLTVTDPENIPENGRSHTVLAADEIVGEVSFDTSVLPGNPGDWRFYRSGNAYRLGRNIGITVIVK